jgi:hypothetical protein
MRQASWSSPLPNWKFYDAAASNFAVGVYSDKEFARSVVATWLLPGYTYRSDIPRYDMREIRDAHGERVYPTSVDPYFWTPEYPSNYPNTLLRNTKVPQGFHMPGHLSGTQLGGATSDPTLTSLFGESHLWFDTRNHTIRWHLPNVIWTPPPADEFGYVFPGVKYLILYSTMGYSPLMLLTMDSVIGQGTYEFDWSGGLFGEEEDRFGIILDIVDA